MQFQGNDEEYILPLAWSVEEGNTGLVETGVRNKAGISSWAGLQFLLVSFSLNSRIYAKESGLNAEFE